MRCLESLSRDSFSGKRTVFLIDNAQSLGRSLAARLPSLDIEIDRPARNLGFAEGCARGISLAAACGADFILLLKQRRRRGVVVSRSSGQGCRRLARNRAALSSYRLHDQATTALVCGRVVLPLVGHSGSGAEEIGHRRARPTAGGRLRHGLRHAHQTGGGPERWFCPRPPLRLLRGPRLSLRARNAGFSVLVVPRARVRHAVADSDRRSQSIYYSTRNLLEVMRRHGTWYHWIGIVPNFLLRWVGFFTVLACLRGRPEFLRALASGVVDFARGRLGERSPRRGAAAARTEAPE